MQRLAKRIGLTSYLNAPHQVSQHDVCLPGLSQDGYAGLHPYLVCGEQGAFAGDVGVLAMLGGGKPEFVTKAGFYFPEGI